MPKLVPSENEKLLQLTTMVLTDSTDGIRGVPTYLFTETSDNEKSGLNRGVGLLLSGVASHLLILDDQDGTNRGYPGAKEWIKHLTGCRNVQKDKLQTVTCEQLLHTFSEACALTKWARERECTELIIVAPPFHQVRAFMSVVSAITRFGPKNLRVYNCPGVTLDWSAHVSHSQGTLWARRRDFVLTEARRIRKYHKMGDLVSVDKALEYLEWRDKR